MVKIDAQLKKLIESNAVAVATVGKDGKPHCIAVGFVKVVGENRILITDNYMVATRDNINQSSEVALVVWDKDWQVDCVGYGLEGQAEYFKDGDWLKKVKNIPENKDEPCKGAILATIDKIRKLA